MHSFENAFQDGKDCGSYVRTYAIDISVLHIGSMNMDLQIMCRVDKCDFNGKIIGIKHDSIVCETLWLGLADITVANSPLVFGYGAGDCTTEAPAGNTFSAEVYEKCGDF